MDPLVRALRPWDLSARTYNSMLADLSIVDSPAAHPNVTHVICLKPSYNHSTVFARGISTRL
jgi:hypothetical protein